MTENTETEHLKAARDLAMQLHIEDYAEIKRLRAALKRIADGTWSTRTTRKRTVRDFARRALVVTRKKRKPHPAFAHIPGYDVYSDPAYIPGFHDQPPIPEEEFYRQIGDGPVAFTRPGGFPPAAEAKPPEPTPPPQAKPTPASARGKDPDGQ
jgi:hypothetical protein